MHITNDLLALVDFSYKVDLQIYCWSTNFHTDKNWLSTIFRWQWASCDLSVTADLFFRYFTLILLWSKQWTLSLTSIQVSTTSNWMQITYNVILDRWLVLACWYYGVWYLCCVYCHLNNFIHQTLISCTFFIPFNFVFFCLFAADFIGR